MADPGTVVDPTGANVTDANLGEGNVGSADGAVADTGLLSEAEGSAASQTNLTPEQQADAELARIMGQDSPLMAQARANAAQQANARGLMNSSMAAGMTQAEMVKAATPLAQQNAQQAFQREMENTENRQESEMFTAEQQNQLTALGAQLGTDVSMFNVEQLNSAIQLQSELRTAIEQGNAEAANNAAQQLADLTRDAQAQQADLDYQASAEAAAATNALNDRVLQGITELNKQHMANLGAADIANIEGTYKQLIAMNNSASSLYSESLKAMAAVMDDPKMSTHQILAATSRIQVTLEASLRMISEVNGFDAGEYGGNPPDIMAGDDRPAGGYDPPFSER